MEEILQRWLRGENISDGMIDRALLMFEHDLERIESLATGGKGWEAYMNLITRVSFLNAAGQQQPSKQPGIIQKLRSWILKIQRALGAITKAVNGNGYSIGVSAPWGVSISISFPTPP